MTIASDTSAASIATTGRFIPLSLSAVVAAFAACGMPTLLAYNTPPSSTFLNQALAIVAWGLFVLLLGNEAAAHAPTAMRRRSDIGAWSALAALALIGLAALGASLLVRLPWSLSLSAVGTLGAAAVCLWAGQGAARRSGVQAVLHCFCLALLLAGVLNTVIAFVQVFKPEWTDGALIAATSLPGRAAGNLRQPNHLSSLMLWALLALLWLADARRLRLAVVVPAMVAFVFTLVLTGSRTGAVGAVLLALWGLVDRGVSSRQRALLLCVPVVYAVGWYVLTGWADTAHATEVTARFSTTGDYSSSRFAIWSDTLHLIAGHPLLGVGFGEFNLAWSLTPFPNRPVAFFDHTHNLPLQLAVELGVPLAALVLALLGFALWRGFRATRTAADPHDAMALRTAWMLALMITLHSLLEYPLWYAYFLLPTAFAIGLCLGGEAPAVERADPRLPAGQASARWLQAGAILMMAVAAYSVVDYWKVVVIFAPGSDAGPLAERVDEGKRSVFFAHHAHYAAATTADHPSQAMDSFAVASHYLLDTRLMMAWAKAYAEAGNVQAARHLADRLREFRNGVSEAFLGACNSPPVGPAAPLFQCVPADRPMDFRDFR